MWRAAIVYGDNHLQRLQSVHIAILLLLVMVRSCNTTPGTASDSPTPPLPPHLQLPQQPNLPPSLPRCSALGDSREDVPLAVGGSASASMHAGTSGAAELEAVHWNLSTALHALNEEDVPADGAIDCKPWKCYL
jgi:hypothetical protein